MALKSADSRVKLSRELIVALQAHGYASWDYLKQRPSLEITRLQREQTIQSVALWPEMTPILMGHLRELLEKNGRPPLRDQGHTQAHHQQKFIYDRFGRKVSEL